LNIVLDFSRQSSPFFLASNKSNLWFSRSIRKRSYSLGWTNFFHAAVWVMELKLGSPQAPDSHGGPQNLHLSQASSIPGVSSHVVYIFSLLGGWRHLHKCGFSLKSKSINLKSETNNARADAGGHLRWAPPGSPDFTGSVGWLLYAFLPSCLNPCICIRASICVCICVWACGGVRGKN